MASLVKERLNVLTSKISANPHCKRVGFADALKSTFSWYGPQAKRLLRQMDITPMEGAFQWVQLPEYGLTWHSSVPLSHLTRALNELRCEGNAHYYFRHGTPVSKGDHVVDVGACEGAFGLECLLNYRAEKVYCFEPDSRMAHALAHTAERNRIADRFEIIPMAVAEKSGTIQFFQDENEVLTSRILLDWEEIKDPNLIEVKVTSLDDWMEREKIERVDYLKVDVEGHDVKTLLGARGLIRCFRPKIAVTTYHEPSHAEEIYDLLESMDLGYHLKVKGLVSFYDKPRPVMLHAYC